MPNHTNWNFSVFYFQCFSVGTKDSICALTFSGRPILICHMFYTKINKLFFCSRM